MLATQPLLDTRSAAAAFAAVGALLLLLLLLRRALAPRVEFVLCPQLAMIAYSSSG
jgi:hypothetical protein